MITMKTTLRCVLLCLVCAAAGQGQAEDEPLPMRIPAAAVEREVAFKPVGGQVQAYEYWLDDEKVGRRVYWENGNLSEEQLLKRGQLHGVWRQYHQNGKLFALRPYRDGLPDGTFVFRDKSGQLFGRSTLTRGTGVLRQYKFLRLGCEDALIPYVDGQIHGPQITWGDFTRTDSRDKQVTHYERGMMEGWSAVYREDGSLLSSAYFHDNHLHGVVRHFDGQGIVEGAST
jgi:antitoxin component YwqK of YwqJK toxin-antitoxin module